MTVSLTESLNVSVLGRPLSATRQCVLEERSVRDSETAGPGPEPAPAAAGLCIYSELGRGLGRYCVLTVAGVLTGQLLGVRLSRVDGLQQHSAVSGPAGSSRGAPETGRDHRIQSLRGQSVHLSVSLLTLCVISVCASV